MWASRLTIGDIVMAAGNWNPTLKINMGTGFAEWPAGPILLSDGESLVRVEAWLMQQTTGGVQMTFQEQFLPNPMAWLADQSWYPSPKHWKGGLFKPGPALGSAIAISTISNRQSYYWWSQEVELSY